jgi:UDP-2,3-diacylglucosamine pyrophosphatase LpxH
MEKRELDICVISDLHLGTFGCHAKELNEYLKSIEPKRLVLNGDIIDIWNFRKRYFPKSHLKVVRTLLKMAANGVQIDYLTGNHDEALRRFVGFDLGNIKLSNKLIIEQHDRQIWIFHGDVFDISIQQAKFIAKLGGWGYDLLIWINRIINLYLEKRGKEKYSLSKRIKDSVKKAVKFIADFEDVAAELAIEKGYDYVICGHIHQPQIRKVKRGKQTTVYMNSGDWVENLSALECSNGKWRLYTHPVVKLDDESEDDDDIIEFSPKELMDDIVEVRIKSA